MKPSHQYTEEEKYRAVKNIAPQVHFGEDASGVPHLHLAQVSALCVHSHPAGLTRFLLHAGP